MSVLFRPAEDEMNLRERRGILAMLDLLERWERPVFPLRGRDLLSLGAAPGPRVGRILNALERQWVESDFSLERDVLLERAARMLKRS